MGSELAIYSLHRSLGTGRFVLLRTKRLGFSNHSETQADLAYDAERTSRQALLSWVAAMVGTTPKETFELIGELQAMPIGETLMAASGGMEVKAFYLHTEYGYPWIILGTASSETAFLSELSKDEDLLGLRPVGPPILIEANCFAESDAALERE